MILMDDFNVENTFPAVLTSKNHLPDQKTFFTALSKNQTQLKQVLLTHGALLLRNFPIHSASCFAKVIETLNLGNFVNYIGGDSPRDKVQNKIYTSTEAPPNLHIPLHQELSFMKNFPRHIYFFCETPPIRGGETIIADARCVYANLGHDIKQRFDENRLTYISHYYHRSKIMNWVNRFQRSHKSWMEVFETDNKNEVEEKCIRNEFNWQWLHRDWLQVKQTRPALIKHPQTNELVWFNQAHLYDFNPRLLGWKRYIGAKLFYWRKTTRLHEITFGNGVKVPREDLYHILDVLNQNTVAFPWQRGDVLILDNILAMHGRAPFKGPRRILTALTS